MRAGRELAVVDISDTGMLVDGVMRLSPGTRVDVHLVTREGRFLVRSRVVRAFIYYLEADYVRYRGGLAFEQRVDTSPIGYAVPNALTAATEPLGNTYPNLTMLPGDASREASTA